MGELLVLERGHSEDKLLYLANGHSRSNLVQLHIFVVHGVGVDVCAPSGSIKEGGLGYKGERWRRRRDK